MLSNRTLLWLLAALCGFAQQRAKPTAPAEQTDFVFRAETNLALVRFYVAKGGRPVTGLRAEDLQLLEDGVPQKIAVLEPPGSRRLPVEVVILLDVSLSVTQNSLLDPLSLKTTILDGMGDQAGISIYAFAARRKRFAENTRDVEELRQAIKDAIAFTHAATPLYEAIRDTAQEAAAAGGATTRVMVIFSDGYDTTETSPTVAVEAANDAGIPLYPVVLAHHELLQRVKRGVGPDPVWARQIQRENQLRGQVKQQSDFGDFGPQTGGQSYFPRKATSRMIGKILVDLVNQIQSQYVAGYYPASTGPPRKRKVEVKLAAKDKGQLHGGTRLVER